MISRELYEIIDIFVSRSYVCEIFCFTAYSFCQQGVYKDSLFFVCNILVLKRHIICEWREDY